MYYLPVLVAELFFTGADYNRTIAPVPEKAVLKEKGKIGSYQHIKTWRSASGVDIVMYSI